MKFLSKIGGWAHYGWPEGCFAPFNLSASGPFPSVEFSGIDMTNELMPRGLDISVVTDEVEGTTPKGDDG